MGSLTLIKVLGHLKFTANALKLPTASAPSGATGWSDKYHRDRDTDSDGAPVTPTLPPPLAFFLPQKVGYSHHQKTVNEIGQKYQQFHDDMLDAVKFAHDMWKLQAKFQNLQVNAVTALGTPGCLDGPELESFIKNSPQAAAMTGNMAKHRDAVAKGVSQCFKKWQGQVTVPGLPWYPAFAAFPGPMAPPMPNVPMPLITCVSSMMTEIMMPSSMTQAMDDALDQGLKDKDTDKHYHALHDAIATVLSLGFTIWLPSQMVQLVLGQGPIPTFAPPFVPVGPVVGGNNIPTPGHLMA